MKRKAMSFFVLNLFITWILRQMMYTGNRLFLCLVIANIFFPLAIYLENRKDIKEEKQIIKSDNILK